MKYVQHINALIKSVVGNTDQMVLFGQNISAGSCLSGLTRGIQDDEKHIVINTPNVENTQVGVGFGLMLNGVSSAFFLKQQDFLLLGIDHLVNTYNFVRLNKPRASFTIVTIVVDSGYQGIQSSLNNFADFCSIARISGYTLSNKHDADCLINTHLVRPGFRIIGVSQRLFNTEILDSEGEVTVFGRGEIFQYSRGSDLTVACFNFTFPQGLDLLFDLRKRGLDASLFSVNSVKPPDWRPILEDVSLTGRLVVLDDSKSVNRSCHHLTNRAWEECTPNKILLLARESSDADLCPNSQEFVVEVDAVLNAFDHVKPRRRLKSVA